MATVKKVLRQRKDGTALERWKVRWLDKPTAASKQNRKSKSFKTKKAADSFKAKVEFRLDSGLPGVGANVGLVGDLIGAFVDHIEGLVKAGKRERSTYEGYEQHLRLHICTDEIAAIEAKKLTAPDCHAFGERLVLKLSVPMAKKVFHTFSTGLKRAVAQGHIAINPAAEIKLETGDRALLSDAEADAHARAVIPEMHEVRAIWQAAEAMADDVEKGDGGRARALIATLAFAGLRISEARGAGIQHAVLFGVPIFKVRRRADKWRKLAVRPKVRWDIATFHSARWQ